MEDDLWWKNIFDERQPLMGDYYLWLRKPLKDDSLWLKDDIQMRNTKKQSKDRKLRFWISLVKISLVLFSNNVRPLSGPSNKGAPTCHVSCSFLLIIRRLGQLFGHHLNKYYRKIVKSKCMGPNELYCNIQTGWGEQIIPVSALGYSA